MPSLRLPPRLEKHEQAEGVKLLQLVGAKVYVIGTRRPKGDYQGTRQTSGLADVLCFLPPRPNGYKTFQRVGVFFEFKRVTGSKLTASQAEFKQMCEMAGWEHVVAYGVGTIGRYLKSGGWVK